MTDPRPARPALALVAFLAAGLAGAATVPEAAEPNDPIAAGGTATVITNDDVGTGAITPSGDGDSWDLGAAAVGDAVFCYVDGRGGVASDDAFVQILSPPALGGIIASDGDSGPATSAARAFTLVSMAGNVGCRAVHQTSTDTVVPYQVYGARVAAADAAAESEPNDTSGTADAITAGMTTGSLAAADVDVFSFPAGAGEEVVVIFDEDADNDGSLADARLVLLSTDGTTALSTVADVDDDPANNTNAMGPVTTSAGGTHFLRVTNGGSGVNGEPYRFVVKVDGGQIVPVELLTFAIE